MIEGRDHDKKKILIIDDEEDLCVLMTHALTLERSDLEVSSARDGAAGLQQARAELPHVIILDVMMPKMDGYEVCRRLKSDPVTRGIPVVMLTASSDPQLNRKAFTAGAIACLTKPYRRTTLINCVDMALGSSFRLRERLS
jgi:two-component system sensor histidine kinase/response regulator